MKVEEFGGEGWTSCIVWLELSVPVVLERSKSGSGIAAIAL